MFVGVDGGGTKTAFLLLSGKGEILSEITAPTCSYMDIGLGQSQELLANGVTNLLAKAGISSKDVNYAFFGLPCYGEDSSLVQQLNALPKPIFPAGNYSCDNDMVNAWAGSLACRDGINIVAGTGSISYGRYDGKSARCGGWGELFGDEGSAYWIGSEGLSSFSRMSDGRLPKGPLYEMFRESLGLSDDLDLVSLVLDHWHGDRAKIAALCKDVFKAAELGDLHAKAIIGSAASELAEIVDATRRKLGFIKDAEVTVSYSGGVFESGKAVLSPFQDALAVCYPQYKIKTPSFSPSIGAALYAAKLSGEELDEQFIRHLTT